MNDIFVDEKYLTEIKSIINKTYPRAIVWAYGSRIDGQMHEGSDLDLVVRDFGQEDAYLFELEEALKDSNIPFLIDIFEFERLPKSFQSEIEKKYVVIYDGQSVKDNK